MEKLKKAFGNQKILRGGIKKTPWGFKKGLGKKNWTKKGSFKIRESDPYPREKKRGAPTYPKG